MLLDKLLSHLAVEVKPFALCLVSPSWRVRLPGPPAPMLHFVLQGKGIVRGPSNEPHPLAPFWLVVVPPGMSHTLESGDVVESELTISHIIDENVDRWLRALRAEVSEDGNTWTRLRTTEKLEDTLADRYLLRNERVGNLSAAAWPVITEAVQDDLKAGPEREFVINAVEHSRVGNLRLAVVESVVCLEIVLGEWLRQVLPNRGIQESKIKGLLSPQLGLSTKLELLLPLLLSRDEIEKLDVGLVIRTIRLRNTVIHKTGNLPTGIPEEGVRNGIVATVELATKLAEKRDWLRVAPDLHQIAQQTATASQVPLLSIEAIFPHHYAVSFDFYFEQFPTDDQLKELASDLGSRLSAYDPRFKADTNLWILFRQLSKTVSAWGEGRLKKLKDPMPSLLPLKPKPPTPSTSSGSTR